MKKDIKHQNDAALLEKLYKLLNIKPGTPLQIQTDGESITILSTAKPVKLKTSISEDSKIQDAFEEVLDIYGPALKKLAKN